MTPKEATYAGFAEFAIYTLVMFIILLFFVAAWDLGNYFNSSTEPGQYVINPTAPDLTDCGVYWYKTDCQP